MAVPNSQIDDVYVSNDGKGPWLARVVRIAGNTVHMERWNAHKVRSRRIRFSLSLRALALSSCGWCRRLSRSTGPRWKISDQQAESLRRERADGASLAELSKRYGVSVSAASLIARGLSHRGRT